MVTAENLVEKNVGWGAVLEGRKTSGEKDIAAADAEILLQVSDKAAEIGRVVDAVIGLKRIADIPAVVSGAVLSALRPADSKSV